MPQTIEKSGDSSTPLRRNLALVLLLTGLFVFAAAGGIHELGKWFTVFFKYYTEAELHKLEAAGFVNASGNSEYVISLDSEWDVTEESAFLLQQDGVVGVRPTDFSHWYVVELSSQGSGSVAELREHPRVDFVFANRGRWFCH